MSSTNRGAERSAQDYYRTPVPAIVDFLHAFIEDLGHSLPVRSVILDPMWILPKQLIALSGSSVTEGIISDLNESIPSLRCIAACEIEAYAMRKSGRKNGSGTAWTRFLSGRMLKLSHAKCFEDWWTSSLQATRVRDSVPPVSSKVLKTLAFYGLGVSGQLQLFNLATVSSRTSTATSRLDSPQSSAIWKKRVTKVEAGIFSAAECGAPQQRNASSSSEATKRDNGSSQREKNYRH
jgi:hypothetical protein